MIYYLTDYNALLETDGQQHFHVIKFDSLTDNLENIKRRDQIKNDYARRRNIHLLRLSYSEFDKYDLHIKHFIALITQSAEVVHMFIGSEYNNR